VLRPNFSRRKKGKKKKGRKGKGREEKERRGEKKGEEKRERGAIFPENFGELRQS